MDDLGMPEVLRGLERTEVPFYGVVYKAAKSPGPPAEPVTPEDEPLEHGWSWVAAWAALATSATMLVTFLAAIIALRR